MNKLVDYISRSTLKREFALMLFFWWAGLGTYLLVRLPVTQQIADASLVAWGALAVPVLTVVTAAFGADFLAKQTNLAGPPLNTETTVKTEITDTSATTTTSSETKP